MTEEPSNCGKDKKLLPNAIYRFVYVKNPCEGQWDQQYPRIIFWGTPNQRKKVHPLLKEALASVQDDTEFMSNPDL